MWHLFATFSLTRMLCMVADLVNSLYIGRFFRSVLMDFEFCCCFEVNACLENRLINNYLCLLVLV